MIAPSRSMPTIVIPTSSRSSMRSAEEAPAASGTRKTKCGCTPGGRLGPGSGLMLQFLHAVSERRAVGASPAPIGHVLREPWPPPAFRIRLLADQRQVQVAVVFRVVGHRR